MQIIKNNKNKISDAILLILFCLLITVSFINQSFVETIYTPFSLRYKSPISGQTAYEARLFSIENSKNDTFWPTFWREDRLDIASQFETFSVKALVYSGDASLVWPAEYLSGMAPGVTDGMGCAISDTLAYRLWGSTDVVGKTVLINNETRIVRGVFVSENMLALVSYQDEDTSQSWSAVELFGGPLNATRNDALNFASLSGLGIPDNIMSNSEPVMLVRLLVFLPILIICTSGVVLLLRYLKKYNKPISRLLPYMLLIGLVIFLPFLLERLPANIIPTRWSDFSFWSGLISQMRIGFRDFLSVSPTIRDIEGSILLIRQVAISFITTILAVIICFRYKRGNYTVQKSV